MAMATLWYFKNGEHISKPLQPHELKQAVNQGMIKATTQVRQGEDGAWFAASQVSGLLTPPPPKPTSKIDALQKQEETTMAMWYYKFGGQIFGPIQPQELRQTVNQGIITATTQVRQGEDGEWCAASSVRGLISPVPPVTSTETKTGTCFTESEINALLAESTLLLAPSSPPTPPPMMNNGTFNAQQFTSQRIQIGRQYTESIGRKAGFFDFGFTKFLTPVLLKIFWVIEVIFACLFPIIVFIFMLLSRPPVRDVPVVIQLMLMLAVVAGCIIASAFYLMASRVVHESVVVIFKIEEHTRTLRER